LSNDIPFQAESNFCDWQCRKASDQWKRFQPRACAQRTVSAMEQKVRTEREYS